MWIYKFMGVLNIILLVIALGLSGYILVGKHSRNKVYLVSGTVLTIMIAVTVMCIVIYHR